MTAHDGPDGEKSGADRSNFWTPETYRLRGDPKKGDEVDETGEAVDPYAPVARLAVALLPEARRRGEAGAGARRLPGRRVRPLRRAEVPLHRAGREPGLVRGGDPRR